MAVPSREEALDVLERGHGATFALLAELSEEQMTLPDAIGGGEWSAKDLVGHLAFWEELSLQALEEFRRGERPRVEDIFDSDEAVDRENADDVARKPAMPWTQVRDAAQATHGSLVGAIRAMSNEEWTARAPYPAERRTTLGALLASVTGAKAGPFAHAFDHLPDLEAYVSALG